MFVPLNIVLYNVFGGSDKGPDLYGVEPLSFYIYNGLLNLNIVFLFSLISLPLIVFFFFFFFFSFFSFSFFSQNKTLIINF